MHSFLFHPFNTTKLKDPKIFFHNMALSKFPVSQPDFDLPLSHSIREYLSIVLPYDLQCLLISDPSSHLLSAAVSVSGGHYQDPKEIPGLAHLCEHLVVGAKTTGLHLEVARAGGVSTAYTSGSHTCFGFEMSIFAKSMVKGIEINALETALEKFSAYFSLQKFDLDVLAREIRAVHDEHVGNTGNCEKILWHGLRLLTNQDHPFHRFSTGNITTLMKPTTRCLKSHIKSYYTNTFTPGKMKLVLKGPQSTNHLRKMALMHFSNLKPSSKSSRAHIDPNSAKQETHANSGCSARFTGMAAISREPELFLDLELNILSIRASEEPRIRLIFPMRFGSYEVVEPVQRQLCNLLGCETPGSWCHFLKYKQQNLRNIVVSMEQVSDLHSVLICDLEITQKGMRHIKETISLFFFFVKERLLQISDQSLDKLLNYFGEIEENLFLRLRPDRSSLEEVCNYSSSMANNSDFGQQKNFIRGYQPWASVDRGTQKVREALQRALTVLKVKVQILDSSFAHLKNFSGEKLLPEKESYYGFDYIKADYNLEEFLVYLPIFEELSQLELLCKAGPLIQEQIVVPSSHIKYRGFEFTPDFPVHKINDGFLEVWLHQISNEPQSCTSVSLKFRGIPSTTENLIGVELLTAILGETLKYKLYHMELMGSNWGFYPNINSEPSILLVHRGDHSSLMTTLKVVFSELRLLLDEVRSLQYEELKRARVLLRRLFTSHKDSKGIAKMEVTIHLILEGGFVSIEDRIDALEMADVEELATLKSNILRGGISISALISGNTENFDLETFKNICESPKVTSESPLKTCSSASKVLPPGANYVFNMEKTEDDPTSIVYYYFQMGSRLDNTLYSVSKLLQFFLTSTSFEGLRTQRSLSYSILTGMKMFKNTFGLFFCVPAVNKDCLNIIYQIEDYLTDLENELLELEPSAWDSLLKRFFQSLETVDEENEFPSSLFASLSPLVSSSGYETHGSGFRNHWNNLSQIISQTYNFGGTFCEEPINITLLNHLSHRNFCKFFQNKMSVRSGYKSILVVTKPAGALSLELRISGIASQYSDVLSRVGLNLTVEELSACLKKCEDKENFTDFHRHLKSQLTTSRQQIKFHKFSMYHKLGEMLLSKPSTEKRPRSESIDSKQSFSRVKDVRKQCLVAHINQF